LTSKIFTCLHNIFLVILFLKKGGPLHLISFGRKNLGVINSGILYRRSKKIEQSNHWNETRLGEISTNWSILCRSSKDVLYDSSTKNLLNGKSKLIHKNQTRVYSCNLDFGNENIDEYHPFARIIEFKNDIIKIEVTHNKTICNYPHSDINCFLTTNDGVHINELVESKDWVKHPLNSNRYRGLRGKYKTHLIYHFSDYEDIEIN